MDKTSDTDYVGKGGIIRYTVSTNGSTSYISRKVTIKKGVHVTAVMGWSDNKRMYFFRTDDEYVRFNMVAHKTVTFLDYPLPVNDHNWPGMGSYGKLIRAAYKQSDYDYVFLKMGLI